jgi:sec-independent protein translocase protein TatA
MPGGWEWLIIIAVLLLLFGAKKLPDMARSIGQSARVFKGEMKGLREDEQPAEQQPAPQQPTQQTPPASLPPTAPTTAAPSATEAPKASQPSPEPGVRNSGQ